MNLPDTMNTVEGFYFDTYNKITAPCSESLLKEAMEQCAKYHNLLSKTTPGSDVWRCNHAEGKPVMVSEDTAKILTLALEMYRNSGGAFNIAIGSAIALWHFTDGSRKLPDPEALQRAVEKADCSKISLKDREVVMPSGMQIDLGGIAKGYIADRIGDFLKARGVTSALLNFGGNVLVIGGKPDKEPWTIGLQTPYGKKGEDFWAAIRCCDKTLVTSGIYERSFVLDGVTYHHLLDPRTGWPVQNDLLTVTVVADESLLADAITTAIFVLGPELGAQLAAYYHVPVVFLYKSGEAYCSPGLDLVIP